MISSNCFAPWQETFADAGVGEGGPFGPILGSFHNHFRTIVRPPLPPKYIFQAKVNFLEMAHTNLVSSIRMTAYQPLIRTKDNTNQHFEMSEI